MRMASLPLARRLAVACEPTIGTFYGVTYHSPQQGEHVSLWIQAKPDGRVQVCAICPMQDYRLLFKEFFHDPEDAIGFWYEQYAELFGTQPE